MDLSTGIKALTGKAGGSLGVRVGHGSNVIEPLGQACLSRLPTPLFKGFADRTVFQFVQTFAKGKLKPT